MKRKHWLKGNVGFLYILPWLIVFLIFKLYPFGSSLVYSFSDYQLFDGILKWGIFNYIDVFIWQFGSAMVIFLAALKGVVCHRNLFCIYADTVFAGDSG